MELFRKAMWSAGGRKFLTVILAAVALPWLHEHGISVDVIFSIAAVAVTFIFGEGAKDVIAKLKEDVKAASDGNAVATSGAKKPEESSTQVQAVRRISFRGTYKVMAIACLLPFVLSGCWGTRPPEVAKAAAERDKALQTYVANADAEYTFLIERYREAEYARIVARLNAKYKEIDEAVQKDLAKLAGPDGKIAITPAQAESVLTQVRTKKQQAFESAESYKKKVDEVVQALYAANAKNKLNLAIATKLNEAVKAYEDAGIDMSMAQQGVDQIFLLLEKYKAVADNPQAAELDAKRKALKPTPEK